MRKLFVFLLLISFIVVISPAQLNASDGKELFLNKCGSCHRNGGEARVFAPTKYAAFQWKKYFERNRHKRRKDISSLLTDAELEKLKTYLMDHAADSEQPEAIGLRVK